jgi:hypothetical protein
VASKTLSIQPDISSSAVRTVFVAAKTWVQGQAGGGWAVAILKFNYETGAQIGTTYMYPGDPSETNYFVPTGMTAFQDTEEALAANARIIVTGYSPGATYGNTDYHTICLNGNLTLMWAQPHSRPGAISGSPSVDETPVAIDHHLGATNYSTDPPVATAMVGITGNTWNGSNWDTQTVFHDVYIGGQVLGVITEDSEGDDTACGIRMFAGESGDYPNPLSYVAGTRGTGEIAAYRYSADQQSAGAWVQDIRTLSISGATFTANAMSGKYVPGTAGDFAFAAGRIAGIDQTHMLLVKFDFYGDTQNYTYGENGYYTSFSWDGGSSAPRIGEALCMDFLSTEGVGTLIALGGYSYRDSSHGNDSVVCLFHENSGLPVLRWSAWTKPGTSGAYDVPDACSAVKIDGSYNGTGSLDDFFVHVASQIPTGTTNMDLRAVVFSSNDDDTGLVPADPSTKPSSGDPVDVSGSSAGGDIPRNIELNPFGFLDFSHNFIVVGDVWNGSTNGFDALTRRFRFTEPQ